MSENVEKCHKLFDGLRAKYNLTDLFLKEQIQEYDAENNNRIFISAKTKQTSRERKSIISLLV